MQLFRRANPIRLTTTNIINFAGLGIGSFNSFTLRRKFILAFFRVGKASRPYNCATNYRASPDAWLYGC